MNGLEFRLPAWGERLPFTCTSVAVLVLSQPLVQFVSSDLSTEVNGIRKIWMGPCTQANPVNHLPEIRDFYKYFRSPHKIVVIEINVKINSNWTIGFYFRWGQWCDVFLVTTASRPAQGPIQSPIQWVTWTVLPPHLHLVQRLRMRGAILPLLQYVFMEWYLRYTSSLCGS
jgi:hypothetical protein